MAHEKYTLFTSVPDNQIDLSMIYINSGLYPLFILLIFRHCHLIESI